MKKLIIPILVIVVLIGAYIAFNKQPGIPDDLSDSGGEPTDETPSGDETQEDEPDAPPTLEKGLKGVGSVTASPAGRAAPRSRLPSSTGTMSYQSQSPPFSPYGAFSMIRRPSSSSAPWGCWMST